LDGLFQTTGAKSALAQGAEDAGSFLDALDKINRRHGLMAAGGAAIVKGATAVASALVPGVEFSTDPFGYQDSASQTAGLKNNKAYNNGQSIGWNQDPATNKYKLPSQITQKDIDVAAEGMKLRAAEEEKANQKRIADEKRLAAERKRALDEISRLEIEESNQRIKDEVAASFSSIEAKYRTNNSDINTPGMAKPTGTDLNYDYGSDKFNKEFSKQSTGDGSAKNFDKIIAGMQDQVEKLKSTYKDAGNSISEDVQQLSSNISSALQNAAADSAVAFGEMIGAALSGGSGFEDAGKKMGLILARMLQDLGKALIAFATLKIAASKVFSNPYVALGEGIEALAVGVVLKNKFENAETQGFYTGGIVKGRSGVDNIPINVSSGEMILTNTQQGRLFGMLDGAYSGHSMNANYGSANSGGGGFSGELSTTIKGTDLDVLLKYGQKKNAKFRG